jgi:ABC-2 type transport system ATP-binding protein
VWIRTLLRSLAAQGRTVLLSSHLMSEMTLTADRLIIIGQGRLITQATIAEFLAAGSGAAVTARSPQAAELAALLAARGAAVTRSDSDTLTVTGIAMSAVGELASQHAITLTGLAEQRATLEDRYMELTRDSAEYRAAAPATAGSQ